MGIQLRFRGETVREGNHHNLSAVRADGSFLWLAGDETATVERLTLDSVTDPTVAGDHHSVALAELVDLPGDADAEADLEGLARHGGHLWAVGSHSLARKKIRSRDSDEKALARLATVRNDPNRHVLVRLALADDGDGRPVPVRDGSAVLAGRTAPDGHRRGGLADLLAEDPHLGPFWAIPSKDNGVDVEGLAVVPGPDDSNGRADPRVLVGLRGPVLRGWAAVVEIRPQDGDQPGTLSFGPLPDGARYRTVFLDLDGLGVRDLCRDGDDLLVLAGPTMALSGPVRVYRWFGAASSDPERRRVVRREDLGHELELPHGEGVDHAEGITVLPGSTPRLLVVHDSPAPERLRGERALVADLVELPRRPDARSGRFAGSALSVVHEDELFTTGQAWP